MRSKEVYIRQSSVLLLGQIAHIYIKCGEKDELIGLGQVVYELLSEKYENVVNATLKTLTLIIKVVGIEDIKPPVNEIVFALTPILRDQNETLQENCIELIGMIAEQSIDDVDELIPVKEWVRICNILIDTFKAHRKSIRKVTINAFGYIAKEIGPQEVLFSLLNNFRMIDRQLRVCTTIAIAVVAEFCSPFTVIPSLMFEYTIPDHNTKSGVLKSLSFLFEYIGEQSKDYIYSVVPLICDALSEKELVHRQLACNVVKNLSLGVFGLGCEDDLLHLLNYVFPNIFDKNPHLNVATLETIDALRIGLGNNVIMQYLLQGLFHPARHVRDVYWKMYNNMYVGNQDGCVASYPVIDDDNYNLNRRYELELFL